MPHGVPTSAELAAAVRQFLQDDVMPAADGRLRFLARVAANAVAQVERELLLGDEVRQAHARRLARLRFRDDAELCAAIRDGSVEERIDEVLAVVRADVVDKLRIANPRHLRPDDAERTTTEQAVRT
jgi:alcohol dehydrogenase class IV